MTRKTPRFGAAPQARQRLGRSCLTPRGPELAHRREGHHRPSLEASRKPPGAVFPARNHKDETVPDNAPGLLVFSNKAAGLRWEEAVPNSKLSRELFQRHADLCPATAKAQLLCRREVLGPSRRLTTAKISAPYFRRLDRRQNASAGIGFRLLKAEAKVPALLPA
jgi:hypothetical protein